MQRLLREQLPDLGVSMLTILARTYSEHANDRVVSGVCSIEPRTHYQWLRNSLRARPRREEYLGETITVWRTFEFEDGGDRRPKRRYHFDVGKRFYSLQPGFTSRDEAFASARRHITLEVNHGFNFGGAPRQERRAEPVPDPAVEEKAYRLRERLELVTEEHGFFPAEVETAKRKLRR